DSYKEKAAAVLAGSLPDIFYVSNEIGIADIPGFLVAKGADLSPHLAGDAIKKFPNLAAIPTAAWKYTLGTTPKGIYGVPAQRAAVKWCPFINATRFSDAGIPWPKTT